jgi:hypothetical protein
MLYVVDQQLNDILFALDQEMAIRLEPIVEVGVLE